MELGKDADSVSTGFDTERRKFTWTIKNFDFIRSSKELICAQKVKFELGNGIDLKTTWSVLLHVCQNGYKIGDHESLSENEDDSEEDNVDEESGPIWIGVYLSLEEAPRGIKEAIACFQIRVLKENREIHKHFINEKSPFLKYTIEPGQVWGWPDVVEKNAQLNQLPLTDGDLVLEIDVTLCALALLTDSKVKIEKDIAVIEEKFKVKFAENLSSDLCKMLNLSSRTPSSEKVHNGEATIVSKDGIEFLVHRAILSVRSPVFERMLQSDMSEARTGIIRIDDISSKTIAVLLQYIYSGTLKEDWSSSEVIVELVNAAAKYQLPVLLEFLDHVVGTSCCKENAGKLLNLAKKLDMKNTEQMVFEFMIKNASTFDEMVKFLNIGLD